MTRTLTSGELAAEAERMDALTVQLGWVLHRQLAQRLKEHELTVPQFTALRALGRAGRPCSMSALAEDAMQVPATMTGIVDRLEEQGLVARAANPADRRSYRVALTARGEELLSRVSGEKRDRLAHYLAKLPAGQREQLLHLLEDFLAALTGVS